MICTTATQHSPSPPLSYMSDSRATALASLCRRNARLAKRKGVGGVNQAAAFPVSPSCTSATVGVLVLAPAWRSSGCAKAQATPDSSYHLPSYAGRRYRALTSSYRSPGCTWSFQILW